MNYCVTLHNISMSKIGTYHSNHTIQEYEIKTKIPHNNKYEAFPTLV